MRWEKLGIVFRPDSSLDWAQTHAMVPTPVRLNEDVIRVYCNHCDANYISRPSYVDVSASDPTKVLHVNTKPLLSLGDRGCFDESGVIACSVIAYGNELLMYYVGYELGTQIRYRLLTGLAKSTDQGKTFFRVQSTPILERTQNERYFRCGPFALVEEDKIRLWYVSGDAWMSLAGKEMPVYDLKYIDSHDPQKFPGEGLSSMQISHADEHGFGRPWIIKNRKSHYEMYYSIRKKSVAQYRLGYAQSSDGIHWNRKDDQVGLDVSTSGFDSEAIMYAAVITVNNETYCFYNGNDFGRDGFALARKISE